MHSGSIELGLKGYVYRQHLYRLPLARGMVLLQLGRWTFLHKVTLQQLLFDLNWFLFTKTINSFFEPPVRAVRGNVRISSIARWKARIRGNWTFSASSYGWDVISTYWSKSAFFIGGERNFKMEGDISLTNLCWCRWLPFYVVSK